MTCLPHPCRECPWSKQTPPGQFTAERYEALRSTTGTPEEQVMPGAPIFACHKTREGAEVPCAGWLASVGIWHIGIRLLIAWGDLPASVLKPGPGWPELFETYEAMASTQARS